MPELGLGLAGETDDDVGGDGNARDELADARHQPPVVGDSVAASHPRQHLVVARLDGNLNVLTDFGQLGDGAQQVISHPVGMAGEEAQSLQAGELVELPQERHERRRARAVELRQIVTVAVHDLP